MASIEIPLRVTVGPCEGCEVRGLLVDERADAMRELQAVRQHRDKLIDELEALRARLRDLGWI
jgi:hypothetical protein